MATGDFSPVSVTSMVWLSGLAPGSLGLQWQLETPLWSELLEHEPRGTPALTLRRAGDGHAAPGSGALLLLERQPIGFRRIAVAPGTYEGEFGWLSGNGDLLVLARVGPASPLPDRPADDTSLVLVHLPAQDDARRKLGAPHPAPSLPVRICRAGPQARVRLLPQGLCPDRASGTSRIHDGELSPPYWEGEGEPPLCDASTWEDQSDPWRASGAHSLPPEVGWPEPEALNPPGAA